MTIQMAEAPKSRIKKGATIGIALLMLVLYYDAKRVTSMFVVETEYIV